MSVYVYNNNNKRKERQRTSTQKKEKTWEDILEIAWGGKEREHVLNRKYLKINFPYDHVWVLTYTQDSRLNYQRGTCSSIFIATLFRLAEYGTILSIHQERNRYRKNWHIATRALS